MGYLTALEYYRYLYLVAFFEKLLYIAQLELEVVFLSLAADLHLFKTDYGLLFLGLFGLLAELVLVLAIVHYAADRRGGSRRDLYKVEPGCFRRDQCVLRGQNAHLIAIGVNNPDLRHPYHPVYSYSILSYKIHPLLITAPSSSGRPAGFRPLLLRGTRQPS